MGWAGGWRESWMRLRDRRAALAALVLVAAYAGLILGALLHASDWLLGRTSSPWPDPLPMLLAATSVILVWRMAVRMLFVWRAYGVGEALRSVPRTIIANIIAMMAARRAVMLYLKHLDGRALAWDKTTHRFPDATPDAGH
jgi:adsorption protein B